MGKTGFNVPIHKVYKYLQVITSDTQSIYGHTDWHSKATLPMRVPSLHLMQRYSQGKMKNEELLYSQDKERGTVPAYYSTADVFISLRSTLIFFQYPSSFQKHFLALYVCTNFCQCCLAY